MEVGSPLAASLALLPLLPLLSRLWMPLRAFVGGLSTHPQRCGRLLGAAKEMEAAVGAGKVLEAMLCRNLGLDSITNLSVVQLRKLAKFFEVVLPHEASEHSNDASKFRANVDIILGAAQGSMHVPSKKELGCIRIKK